MAEPTETSHKVSLLSWRPYNFYPENFRYKAHGSHSTAKDCLIGKFGRYSKYLVFQLADIVPVFFLPMNRVFMAPKNVKSAEKITPVFPGLWNVHEFLQIVQTKALFTRNEFCPDILAQNSHR